MSSTGPTATTDGGPVAPVLTVAHLHRWDWANPDGTFVVAAERTRRAA